jgi:hypothetical protein
MLLQTISSGQWQPLACFPLPLSSGEKRRLVWPPPTSSDFQSNKQSVDASQGQGR